MSPSLALLLCTALCIYLVRKDAEWHVPVEQAIWLPTLWIMRCASRNIGVWFIGGDADVTESLSWYDPTFFVLCTLAGWRVLLARRLNWPELGRLNAWLFLFFAYMLVSCAWSPIEGVSYKRWFRTFGDLTMALVIATSAKPNDAMWTVLRRCTYLLVPLSVVLIKYFPDLGRMPAKHWTADSWIGVATHKNTLGQLCIVAGLWLLWEYTILRRSTALGRTVRRGRQAVLALYALLTLFLFHGGGKSQSTTSILAFGMGAMLFMSLPMWQSRPRGFWRLVASLLVAWIILQPGSKAILGKSAYEVVLQLRGENPTLTDRTMLWTDCLEVGMRHPLLGSGYGGFWTESVCAEIKEDNLNGPGEAHNGYIEIFLHLGIVGVALFLPLLLRALSSAWHSMRPDFELGRLRSTLLVLAMVHNYAESGFPRPTHLIWFLFLVGAVTAGARAQRSRALPPPLEAFPQFGLSRPPAPARGRDAASASASIVRRTGSAYDRH